MLSSLRLGSLAVVVASLQGVVLAHPKCGGCAADECFTKASLPAAYSPTLSSFCYGYLSSTTATSTITATVTVTDTATDSGVVTLTATETVTDSITTTETAINTATTILTPSPVPGTVTETETETTTSTVTSDISCTLTSTTTLDQYPTSVFFKVRGTPGASVTAPALEKRSLASASSSSSSSSLAVPTELSRGCKPDSLPAKLSAACSCVLQSATTVLTTVTATATQLATTAVTNTASVTGTASITEVATVTATVTETITETTSTAAPGTVTITTTTTVLTTTESCSSTATELSTVIRSDAVLSCGVPTPTAPASGSIVCANVVPTQASEQAIYFRIEGGDQGTVFDSCLAVGPGTLTTSSGGTHQCGNSNRGNLNRGIQAAAGQAGFTFDGTFSPSFNDYFITRIGADAQSGNMYWGVLDNGVFTTSGGCGASVQPEDRGLWQWNAFTSGLQLLSIEPQYQVVASGTASVTVSVTARSPNGGASVPAAGATVAGTYVADALGQVTIPVPGPGCYQYKAESSNSGRSNTFYLSVLQ